MRALLLFLFLSNALAAQPVTTYTRFCSTCGVLGAESVLSQSGQFIVHGTTERAFPPRWPENAPPLIELEPQLVAVTAERTKRVFLETLGAADSFRDKVHVLLLSRGTPLQPIKIVSHIHPDGFQYQMGLPIYLESSRLIKALVQVLLQEYSNREARRSAELPGWLVEGLARQIMSSVVPAPVNRTPFTIERLGYDRLGPTRVYFQTNNPMTIQELSFSSLPSLSSAERLRYECSAHLFVHELLRVRGGPVLLGQFVQGLPFSMNWQTAFHKIYQAYFRTPLDLEKWWMLTCLEIKQREAHQAWATQVSLERLDAALRVPMEYRVSSNAIPQHREASLQEFLMLADFSVQRDLLGQKLQQMFFISVNFSPQVRPVAEAYEQAIENYLQKRMSNDLQPGLKSDPEQRAQLLVKSTIRLLDELDRARQDVSEGRAPKLPQRPKTAGRQVLITRGSALK